MNTIVIRNCRIFFRNKRGVLSSMFAALVVIILYIFFLGDKMKQGFPDMPDLDYLLNSWVMSGFIGIASMTTTLGMSSLMIRDREGGNLKDFLCSPMKSYQLTGGYTLSVYVIGVIMTLFTLAISEVYIVFKGGSLLDIVSLTEIIGVIILTVLASSAMIFFVVSLFRRSDTFHTAGSIIAPLMGFLTGIYIPIGSLPPIAQMVVKVFPISHGTVLMRQIMMKDAMSKAFVSTPANTVLEIKQELGVNFQYGNVSDSVWLHILVLLGTVIVFYGLATLIKVNKKNKFN